MTAKPHSYERVIKRFLILISLFILSPTVLSLAFKALKIYKTGGKNIFACVLFIIGALLICYTVYFGFKTIKLLLDTLFKK